MSVGKRNQRLGKSFEKQITDLLSNLFTDYEFKRLDRYNYGLSQPDIVVEGFPHKIDCKRTDMRFTPKQKLNLLQQTVDKYGEPAIVVLGECHGGRMVTKNCTFLVQSDVYDYVELHINQFARHLEEFKNA